MSDTSNIKVTDAMVEAAIRVPWITVAGQRADARRILTAALSVMNDDDPSEPGTQGDGSR